MRTFTRGLGHAWVGATGAHWFPLLLRVSGNMRPMCGRDVEAHAIVS